MSFSQKPLINFRFDDFDSIPNIRQKEKYFVDNLVNVYIKMYFYIHSDVSSMSKYYVYYELFCSQGRDFFPPNTKTRLTLKIKSNKA